MTEDYIFDVLMQSLPELLRDSVVYQSIMRAYAVMLKVAWDVVAQAARNIYLDTAVDVLQIHARDIGIQIAGMTDRDAREVIRAAWWSTSDVVQAEDIIEVANNFTYGGLAIDRTDEAGRYDFVFNDVYGRPAQLDALDKVLKRMVGAEYLWEYIFRYMTWDEFDAYNKTWDAWDALNLSWDDFEKYKEVI